MGCRTPDIDDDCTTSESYQLRHDNPLLHAPRETRTPPVQTDHKALNLARGLPDPSECGRYAHLIRAAGRSRRGGLGVCCHGVVTCHMTYVSSPKCRKTTLRK